MVPELEAEYFFFPQRAFSGQNLERPGCRRNHWSSRLVSRSSTEHVEQAGLAGARRALVDLRGGNRRIEPLAIQQCLALTEAVHGPALDQRLQDALVDGMQVLTAAELFQ